VGGYQWFLATPFGLLTAPLLTELNTNHLTGKRTPAAATKLQKTIYFNSISNKSRLELNVRQNGTIHEIQETHHVFFKKKKKQLGIAGERRASSRRDRNDRETAATRRTQSRC